jgi:serine/threonine protein kinase
MIGTRLSHYEITNHLGTGGMGEVYRATDTKLGRSVAIKRLPVAFASDPDHLSRFRREAQVLASLNHPNIAHVYGLEESGETQCIVRELVEGETLQQRIKRGPVPVDVALTISKQIAESLEAAHEKGVIHRHQSRRHDDGGTDQSQRNHRGARSTRDALSNAHFRRRG